MKDYENRRDFAIKNDEMDNIIEGFITETGFVEIVGSSFSDIKIGEKMTITKLFQILPDESFSLFTSQVY